LAQHLLSPGALLCLPLLLFPNAFLFVSFAHSVFAQGQFKLTGYYKRIPGSFQRMGQRVCFVGPVAGRL
ncbi:MAG: hypothetical protein ACRER5_04525, partial [Pseudomonas sp.]